MAQGDLFRQLTEINGVLDRAYQNNIINEQRRLEILGDVYTRELNISEVRNNMLKSDTKSLNVLKKISSVGGKISNQAKENFDIKKKIIRDEKFLLKLQEEINKANKDGNIQLEKALETQAERLKLDTQLNKVTLQQMRNVIPLLGRMGSVGSLISDGMVMLGGIFSGISLVVGGILTTLIKIGGVLFRTILGIVKKTFNKFLEIQSVVGNLAADIGLTAFESKNLLNNFASLTLSAMKFGGSMKDVAAIFQSFSETTNKNRFFSEKEIGQLIELGLGTGLGVQGASELASSFDNIGLSLEKTINLTDKARNLSAKMNLNTTKVLKTYQGLVQSLTGIGFGRGLDNLTKLAAKATAIRFDVAKSAESFTDQFFDLEKAVEASARMQVLGGRFAENFGDPMTLAFESMNDPAKLAERVTEVLKGSIIKSGNQFLIPPQERAMLKILAEQTGQDYKELTNTAIEQAKIMDKMSALTKSGANLFGFKEEDKIGLANLMTINEKGGYEIRMSDGTTKLLENITDSNQLKSIIDTRKANDKAAIQRLNLMERLSLISDRFIMGVSKVFDKLFGTTSFDSFLSMVENASTRASEFILKAIGGSEDISKSFETLLSMAKSVFKQIESIFSDDKSGILDKIGKSVKLLFNEFVIPSLKKLFDYVMPLIQYTFGQFLEVIGNILPDILGGSKAKRKGLEMQQSALDKGGFLSDMFSKEGMVNKKNEVSSEYTKSKEISGGERITNFLTGGFKLPVNMARNVLDLIFTDLNYKDFGKKQNLITSEFFNDATFGHFGKDYNPYEKGKSYAEFDDGVIYKDGTYSKFAKGDMVQFIDQAAMERANNSNASVGSTNMIQHSGVITIKSDDGKVVTWDQMYASRDLIGGRLASIMESQQNGFGNFQNPNTSPIQPLL
jgi:hypothetical protein